MGLDTTHNCWHGPYSSFMRFRTEIAKAVGMNLEKMAGFHRERIPDNSERYITDGVKTWVDWEELPYDPIYILLNHSDCDGEIEHKDCLPLANRMKELLPFITDEYSKTKAEQFIEGLILAHNQGENVEFH